MVGNQKRNIPVFPGVLFLDELPVFKKNVLEVLREPMEDARVTISWANFRDS